MDKTLRDKDLEYIKKFGSIKISVLCRKAKVDKGNLYNGRASFNKTREIKDMIHKEIEELEKLYNE
jgi:hypothetical protein